MRTETGSPALADLAEPRPRPDEALVAGEAFSPNHGETFVLERAAHGFRPRLEGAQPPPAGAGRGRLGHRPGGGRRAQTPEVIEAIVSRALRGNGVRTVPRHHFPSSRRRDPLPERNAP